MNIAITVWEDRISPVFDSGRTLLIAKIKDNAVVSTAYLPFDFDRPLEFLRMLRSEKIKIIISGAISEGQANMLLAEGYELISFIAGDVRRVLETFAKGETLGEDFRMPGCCKNICCRGKIRRGRELSTFNDNLRRVKGLQRQSSSAVPEISNNNNDSATSTEKSVRLSEKL
jgi:predicted Fe-Mo cluster-binding NifX family protein